MRRAVILCLLLLLPVSIARGQTECGGSVPCPVGERSYFAQPPASWDGVSTLPVLLHFHGWGRTGLNVLRNARIADAAAHNGFLLVAPNGLGKSWSFWSPDTLRDVEFTDAVLKDIGTRFPVDDSRIFASGFSYGAAMIWRLACSRGEIFAGFLSIAGTLRSVEREHCSPVARLWHVHGRQDSVMELPVGPRGDLDHAMGIWRRANRITEDASITWEDVRFTCKTWQDQRLVFCLHGGGHWIPKDWLPLVLPKLSPT